MKSIPIETLTLITALLASFFIERRFERIRGQKPSAMRTEFLFFFQAIVLTAFGRKLWSSLFTSLGLLNTPDMNNSSASGALRFFAALLTLDFAIYCLHRLCHWGPLWQLHRAHHSLENLTAISGFRDSATHLLLFALPGSVIPTLFRVSHLETQLILSLVLLAQVWTHWGVAWDFGVLKSVVISPMHHALHHSSAQAHENSNFGGLFCVWDRILGTYLAPTGQDREINFTISGEPLDRKAILGFSISKGATP